MKPKCCKLKMIKQNVLQPTESDSWICCYRMGTEVSNLVRFETDIRSFYGRGDYSGLLIVSCIDIQFLLGELLFSFPSSLEITSVQMLMQFLPGQKWQFWKENKLTPTHYKSLLGEFFLGEWIFVYFSPA